MDDQHRLNLDDLVRDPNDNFIYTTTNNEQDSDTTHDYPDPQLTDSPYTQSTFNTDYYDITDF